MQEITINNVKYQIPISWSDVKYSKVINIIKDYNDKTLLLSHVCDIPVEVINKIADSDVSKLFGVISFIEDLSIFENTTPKEEFKDFKFKDIEYGEAEYCRKIMRSGVSGYEAISKIINRLVKVDINDHPVTEVIGTANFFLTNSIISMIIMPNLERVKSLKSSSELALEDSLILGALERMSNLLEVERLETQ